RARFTDRLQHAIDRQSRRPSNVAVLFIDLDDFKLINDRLGHPVGDLVLVEVARRISQTIGPADTAARFGGDEFAVLLEEPDGDAAAILAETILRTIAAPFLWEQKELQIHASIGIALGTDDLD